MCALYTHTTYKHTHVFKQDKNSRIDEKNLCLTQDIESFSSKNFIVLSLALKPVSHFGLIFVHSVQ